MNSTEIKYIIDLYRKISSLKLGGGIDIQYGIEFYQTLSFLNMIVDKTEVEKETITISIQRQDTDFYRLTMGNVFICEGSAHYVIEKMGSLNFRDLKRLLDGGRQ